MTAAERLALTGSGGGGGGRGSLPNLLARRSPAALLSSSLGPGGGSGGGGAAPLASFKAHPAGQSAVVRGSIRFAELLKPPPKAELPPDSSLSGRGQRAGGGFGVHGGGRPESGRFVSTSGQLPNYTTASSVSALRGAGGAGSTLTGMAAVMAARDPPIVLRETLPLPECSFPHIASKVHSHIKIVFPHITWLCHS